MLVNDIIFPYFWHWDDTEKDVTVFRVYALDKQNKTVVIRINDFTPYCYLELPDKVDGQPFVWDATKSQMLTNSIAERLKGSGPIKTSFVMKKRLYYSHLSKDGKKERLFPYLLLAFSSASDRKGYMWTVNRKRFYVNGLGNINCRIHEEDADPLLQFICHRSIPTAGWIKIKGKQIGVEEQITHCDKEYTVRWKNIKYEGGDDIPQPLILAMDIEVNSTNPSRMPCADVPGDKVFQISCILKREGNKKTQNFILSLGEPNQKITGKDVTILSFRTEADLLVGYSDFLKKYKPNIVTGYNILGFDMEYMIERAKFNLVIDQFQQQGFTKYITAKEKQIKWSSAAYKTQHFKFLNAEGMLHVDLLPLIKRDYKFNNYKLKTVSEFFIGKTKDPLDVAGIFKCYRVGMKGGEKGAKALGVCAKYCVQDSVLVVEIFDIIQTWVGLCEMAKVCNVSIFDLYTKGQQIKVYSQVYKKCMYDNRIVEKDGYTASADECFTGAYVFQPKPGVYDKVVPFDFSSLYPTTIIAYNIDYSTLVRDDQEIPDSACNIIEWHDHQNCVHDTEKKKTKGKVVCAKRRYRFLKSPIGVLPALLQNLLDARTNTKKEMKGFKKQLKEMKKGTVDYLRVDKLITVLDKRQQSYKVSCNSVYGSMGVHRGYLPFLPGAMCTTAWGRENIQLAAKRLQDKHDGDLVYGDSVTGDTPMLLRNKTTGEITFKQIDDMMVDTEWKSYKRFKLGEEGRTEKQQRKAENYEIYTSDGWSDIVRVIRHKTVKKMYRINTHTGMVDVTEDHSLLDEELNILKPKDAVIGTNLCHNYPVFEKKNIHLDDILEYIATIETKTVSEKEAFIFGFFYGDGSCGKYRCPSGLKYSWALNQKSMETSILLKSLCETVFNETFAINNTIESSGVYKTVPRCGNIKKYVEMFRDSCYNKNRLKIIPDRFLNGEYDKRLSYFAGYYMADGSKCKNEKTKCIRMDNKGKIGSAMLFYLTKSLGLNVSVNTRSDKLDIIRLTATSGSQRKPPNSIKKIEFIGMSDDFVYDIETKVGNFNTGFPLIVKNTDSCYIHFPQFEKADKLWDFCLEVEEDISSIFPPPMRMAFEEVIYWQFLILTKKRYMYLDCGRDGIVAEKIGKKGVLLARRDNSAFIRMIYEEVVNMIFERCKWDEVMKHVCDRFNNLCSAFFSHRDFVITKSIGEISEYKVMSKTVLKEDPKKRKKQIEGYYIECHTCDYLNLPRGEDIPKCSVLLSEYENVEPTKFSPEEEDTLRRKLGDCCWLCAIEEWRARKRGLPAHVQLAEKLRRRGQRVDAGERLEYIVTNMDNVKAKLWRKLEHPDYFKSRTVAMQVDYHYYLKLLSVQLDQLIEVAYRQEKFTSGQLKVRLMKQSVGHKIKELFEPEIIIK